MSAGFVDEIFQAFADRGGDFYGENVSQLEHALQCAFLASEEGASDHLTTAALLHDIGHLFEGRGDVAEREGRDARHEVHGARMLKGWFGPHVAGAVALHVAAKRYLCVTEPGYEEALSPASRLSLELQGGRFAPEERIVFERSPFAADAVRLRRWDDAGKIPDLAIPGLEHYRPLLERLAVV
jgi:[1-hydroxy-2-(trimethylamino)ethyl]phosphonate dioxygenase